MNINNCITIKKRFKHLISIQRGRLEEMSKTGSFSQVEMAKELCVNQPTIYPELRRGRTRLITSNQKYYFRYIADLGARVYQDNRQFFRAKKFRKYSQDFLKELLLAILSKSEKPREHNVDTFVYTYRRDHPGERLP